MIEACWRCMKLLFFIFIIFLDFVLLGTVVAQEVEDTIHLTDEIVVTGSRTAHRLADSPVATELITRKSIEGSNAKSAADLLEDYPGIDLVRSFRGAAVRLQGLDAKHVLILVDGQLLSGRVDGVVDISRIAAEDIDHIEIVKGPSSALYGSDAIGGVINIITRRTQSEWEGSGKFVYGSYNALDIAGSAGFRSKDWNTNFSLGAHRIDAFDLDLSDIATSGSAFQKFNIANRSEYKFNEMLSIVGRVDYLHRDAKGIDVSSRGAVFDRRNLSEVFSLSLSPTFAFEDLSKLKIVSSFNSYRDQFLRDQRKSSALDSYQEQKEQLSQTSIQYDRLMFENHLFTLGLEGIYENLLSERIQDGQKNRFRSAIFLQDEWNIFDDPLFVLIPGIRLDLDSVLGLHPTPKIAFRYDPHSTITFRGGYGIGFRSPSFKERLLFFENPSAGYVVVGNPKLSPETSQSMNLGVEFRPKTWAWFSFNLFHNDIKDLIAATRKSMQSGKIRQYTYANIHSAFTQGLEINSRFQILKGFQGGWGVAFLKAIDKSKNKNLEGRASIRSNFDLVYNNQDWALETQIRGSIVGARPFYSPLENGVEEAVFAKPYATLEFRMEQSLGKHFSIFGGAENVLDVGDSEYLMIQPRSFYTGIKGRL